MPATFVSIFFKHKPMGDIALSAGRARQESTMHGDATSSVMSHETSVCRCVAK